MSWNLQPRSQWLFPGLGAQAKGKVPGNEIVETWSCVYGYSAYDLFLCFRSLGNIKKMNKRWVAGSWAMQASMGRRAGYESLRHTDIFASKLMKIKFESEQADEVDLSRLRRSLIGSLLEVEVDYGQV